MAYMSMGEGNRRITEYLNRFSDAISYQDASTLKRLLSLSSESPSLLSLADALNLTQEFRSWESAWALEALYVRVLAEKADRQLSSNGKNPEKLSAAGSFLMKAFGILAVKGPKRVGALYVTCRLFKVYFKFTFAEVIRSIETARIFDFEEFPVRDKDDPEIFDTCEAFNRHLA